MARKPGPVRELNIDACRLPVHPDDPANGAVWTNRQGVVNWTSYPEGERVEVRTGETGRWPANLILTDPIFDGGWEGVVGGGEASNGGEPTAIRGRGGIWHESEDGVPAGPQYGDTGTYSRFYLIPKAATSQREPIISGQLEPATRHMTMATQPTGTPPPTRENTHPTVKPVDLMRHLVRLVTPTGGTVLDPFLGSGTTAIAAELEGYAWIGIEREAEYVAIAEARLNGTQRGLGLDVPAPDRIYKAQRGVWPEDGTGSGKVDALELEL